jgi:phosphopantetheinyl transferase
MVLTTASPLMVIRYLPFRSMSATQERICAQSLCRTDQERAARLARKEDRQAFLAAHWLHEECLKESATILKVPAMEALHSSLTHTVGMAACAFGRVRCGIDAEFIDGQVDWELMLDHVCVEREKSRLSAIGTGARRRGFFDLWVLKESYLKATGVGIEGDFHDAAFDTDENGATVVKTRDGTDWHGRLLRCGPTHSLAAVAAAPPNGSWEVARWMLP